MKSKEGSGNKSTLWFKCPQVLISESGYNSRGTYIM